MSLWVALRAAPRTQGLSSSVPQHEPADREEPVAAQVSDILLLSSWLCLYSIIQSSAELHQPARSQAASALLAHELHTRGAPWKVTDYFSPTGLLLCLLHLCAMETHLSII